MNTLIKNRIHFEIDLCQGGLFVSAMLMSSVLHLAAFGGLVWEAHGTHAERQGPMRVTIAEKPKEPAPVAVAPTIPPKVEHPKEHRRKPPPEKAKPVAGLTANSFSETGTGFVAPAGNTLMMADNGERLSPDQIEALKGDLSAEPQLIAQSVVKPEYTQDAIDAGFEGRVVVDVYVDATGKVVQAELPRRVGYQMDGRILEMARAARFIPRKNPVGQSIAGWGQIKVNLTLD